MEVIGDGVMVDFAERPLLRADGGSEIAEMIDGERDVRRGGLADRLAIVPCLGQCELLQIRLHPVGDLEEDLALVRPGSFGPIRPCARVRGVRAASTSEASERAISQTGWPVIGETLSKYLPASGARHSPPM